MRRPLVALVALLAACSTSSSDTPSFPRPTVEVRQLGPIFFGSGFSAPVTIEVQVTNKANVPIRVREIELSSPSMSEYALARTRRTLLETLGPGETRSITVPATAVTNYSRLTPTEPLSLRTIVLFEAEGKNYREVDHHNNIYQP